MFEKKDVIQKLGRTIEEWKLISKYQKQFPMLSTIESKDKHPIDGEELCNALMVKDDYTSWLLADRKSKVGKLIKYGFKKDIDYRSAISRSKLKQHGGQNKHEIKLSVNCAKKIAMKQNNEWGDLVTDYFILMELLVKDMNQWMMIRHPEKEGYKQLTKALSREHILANGVKADTTTIYTEEADMINTCLLGARAKEIRKLLDAEDNHTREYLSMQVNQALYELQIVDVALISSKIDFEQRRSIIENQCKTRYKHITLAVKELEGVA